MNLWDLWYLFRPPWDSGVTPPELTRLVESGALKPGKAIDLGCGTGTNVVYLAQHGFDVVGVDVARLAIVKARRKAKAAKVAARFFVHDVTDLSFLRETFDFALDMGCLHSLNEADRTRYAASLGAVTRPGSLYLLYAFAPRQESWGPAGISREGVEQIFADSFRLTEMQEGTFAGRPSAWYYLARVS